MTQVLGALKFYTVEAAVLTAVRAALTNDVALAGVVPGAIAWDACDCGMLAVSLSRVWLSDTFPDPEPLPIGNCTPAWEAAEIVVQLIRCAPGNVTAAVPYPPSTDQDAAARILAADAFQVLSSVSLLLCGLKEDGTISDYIIQDQTVMGPEGGCVGTELRMVVGMPRG